MNTVCRICQGTSLKEVMDFGGADHRMRLLSLHPGITVQQVRDNTGFEL